MAQQLKREVKERAHSRRGERVFNVSGDYISHAEATTGQLTALPNNTLRSAAAPICDLLKAIPEVHNNELELPPETSWLGVQHAVHGIHRSQDACGRMVFEGSDTALLMFYLEKVLPFLFPFYHPPLLQGGKAWILEMMIRRPLVRKAILCQSFYFSFAWGTTGDEAAWKKVLTQTGDAFGVLRQALQIISDSHIAEHLHGAVRIMASIMQLQRFETAVLSFDSWQVHLNAALALFTQLLDSVGTEQSVGHDTRFNAVVSRLGPSSSTLSTQSVQLPTAEQAAFRFSSALVILDDIIASTMLQEQPRLYEYHLSLLKGSEGTESPINLEAVIGVQNLVLLGISEVATLDAWKQRCRVAGSLDVIELAHRAMAIKEPLLAHLRRLEAESEPAVDPKESSGLLDVVAASAYQPSEIPAIQGYLITRVWAHAALIYLSVVVSGWQVASADVRHNVDRIIELLSTISPPAMLRTMVWPFCVAGCLAEPAQETQLRRMVDPLPLSVFGTVHKALRIMENVWQSRDVGDITTRDLAACFRSQGDVILLL
ncbi:MAG: hypothetical protein Q9157_005077 [Trypethelium eluteriae]